LLARASPGTAAAIDGTKGLRRLAVSAAVGPLGPLTQRLLPLASPVRKLPPTRLGAYLTRAAANGEPVSALRARALAAGLADGSACLFGADGPDGELV